MKKITEKDLIIPALVAIYNKGGEGLLTQELIPLLRDQLKPEGQDVEILEGRNDDKFSQKVRNLKSHDTLKSYTEFIDNKYFINDDGVSFLDENNALPENSADITESEIQDQIYDFKPDKSFDAVDEYLSVFDLKRKYNRYQEGNRNNVLILNPYFQRESGIWTPRGKSLFIESILLGIPIPSIYVAEEKSGSLIVIDGRQRLTTIFEFLADKFKLAGLQYLKEINKKKFSQLEESYRSRIEDKMFHLRKIRYGSDEKFVIETFKRVNTQGVNLNAQEIRNALHNGNSTDLLDDLSANFIDEDGRSIFIVPSKRMKDRYLMLRYFAMQRYYKEFVSGKKVEFGSITDYLADTMKDINSYKETQIEDLKINFLENYIRCLKVFNESSFRLREGLPVNMIIFEISMLFAGVLKDKTDIDIKNALEKFYKSDIVDLNSQEETPFEKNIRYHRDSRENIEERFRWIKKIVEND